MQKLVSFLPSLVIVFVAINLQACDVVQQMLQGTPTPTFTLTPTEPPATNTPSPTPTKTPTPTSTRKPTQIPTPTSAPIGSTVSDGPLEITVIDVINLESVHFDLVTDGWETFYTPRDGRFLIDVGVLVRNNDPVNVVRVNWKYVNIVEETNKSNPRYPIWGDTLSVDDGMKRDPFTIALHSTEIEGNDVIEFENDTYLRLIYGVKDDPNQVIYFGIRKSPYISFTLAE